MTTEDAAIARMEVQVAHLIEGAKKQEVALERVHQQLSNVQETLAQSTGGLKVLQWLGLGSLGGLIAAGAAVYHWIKGG